MRRPGTAGALLALMLIATACGRTPPPVGTPDAGFSGGLGGDMAAGTGALPGGGTLPGTSISDPVLYWNSMISRPCCETFSVCSAVLRRTRTTFSYSSMADCAVLRISASTSLRFCASGLSIQKYESMTSPASLVMSTYRPP